MCVVHDNATLAAKPTTSGLCLQRTLVPWLLQARERMTAKQNLAYSHIPTQPPSTHGHVARALHPQPSGAGFKATVRLNKSQRHAPAGHMT
jgi:hypothetical protein